MSDYKGPERRQFPRETPKEAPITDRIITRLGIIERLLKGGFLEREQPTVPHDGFRA